jgi:hypothetical protein
LHSDGQIVGGIENNLPVKDADLDRFVQSVANAATMTIDLAQSPTVTTDIGSNQSWQIVYARGSMVNGAFTEGPLHLSGNQNGYGILLVEIDDPAQAQVIMSGQYRWTGLVLIVVNKRMSSDLAIFDIRGGGQDIHIVGGAMIYHRNRRRSNTENGAIYGKCLYQTRGNADLKYCSSALDQAYAMVPSSLRVRSWRKL